MTFLTGLNAVPTKAEGYESNRIRPYTKNPYYWQYKGEPVILLGGSDDDNLFQWTGSALTDQLDLLKSVGGNYVRNTMSDRDKVETGQVPGLNVDNVLAFAKVGDKYDLDQWNEEYWDRLRNFMEETAKRDIIVQLTFWDIHDIRGKVHIKGQTGSWESHPWNPRNNVNYTSAETGLAEELDDESDSDLINQAKHPFFATVPSLNNVEKVLRYQEKYVRKILSICLPYGHVLYNVENEAHGQELLFAGRFSTKKWEKIRHKAGLSDLKFHDLRKTFASLLAQQGVSTAVTQRLLEHSSPQLTNDVYTNVDPVLRQAINLLPVAEWL